MSGKIFFNFYWNENWIRIRQNPILLHVDIILISKKSSLSAQFLFISISKQISLHGRIFLEFFFNALKRKWTLLQFRIVARVKDFYWAKKVRCSFIKYYICKKRRHLCKFFSCWFSALNHFRTWTASTMFYKKKFYSHLRNPWNQNFVLNQNEKNFHKQ